MANKHMMKCSTSVATTEKQIKMMEITTHLRMAITKKTKAIDTDEVTGKKYSYTFDGYID
jgi:hypothetical protein